MAIHDKTTTNKWTYERSHKSLNSYSLVEYNKIYPKTNSWKTLQEESSWQDRFWQPVFLKHFKQNSSWHLSVKQKWKIAYNNKKHVYKEIKETTHGEIGELITTSSSSSYIYISKINTMYVNMVTRPVYKKLKKFLKQQRGKHSP